MRLLESQRTERLGSRDHHAGPIDEREKKKKKKEVLCVPDLGFHTTSCKLTIHNPTSLVGNTAEIWKEMTEILVILRNKEVQLPQS